MDMKDEEYIIREAQRLERLKDLLVALRRRGYNETICAEDAHVWGLPINDRFRVEGEGEDYAYVARTTDYECTACGLKRHRVEVYNLADISMHDSDPFAELNRAQDRSEEE